MGKEPAPQGTSIQGVCVYVCVYILRATAALMTSATAYFTTLGTT